MSQFEQNSTKLLLKKKKKFHATKKFLINYSWNFKHQSNILVFLYSKFINLKKKNTL